MYDRINELLSICQEQGFVESRRWPSGWLSPSHFGLWENDGLLKPGGDLDFLSPIAIEKELELAKLLYFHAIGSTNSHLLDFAKMDSVDNYLATAECQLNGRGRRGRSWSSPYARNIAFSYGKALKKTIGELGGLSLVVGLAIVEAISSAAVQLKWPNDLVVGEAKLCGILVELISREKCTEIVAGVGVNVELEYTETLHLEREVTDLQSLGVTLSRTELMIQFVGTLQKFLARFDEDGFQPFVDAFNESHIYNGKTCNIHQGDTIITGRVEGVDVDGALILSTENGLRSFHGGEVSLRAV